MSPANRNTTKNTTFESNSIQKREITLNLSIIQVKTSQSQQLNYRKTNKFSFHVPFDLNLSFRRAIQAHVKRKKKKKRTKSSFKGKPSRLVSVLHQLRTIRNAEESASNFDDQIKILSFFSACERANSLSLSFRCVFWVRIFYTGFCFAFCFSKVFLFIGPRQTETPFFNDVAARSNGVKSHRHGLVGIFFTFPPLVYKIIRCGCGSGRVDRKFEEQGDYNFYFFFSVNGFWRSLFFNLILWFW